MLTDAPLRKPNLNNAEYNPEQSNPDQLTARPSQCGQLAQAIQAGRSEALFTYLQTMAKFPTYSARNVLLIAAQRPTATHLEGVRSWNELGRSVRPGEKGIRIFAPAIGIKPKSQAQDTTKTSRKRKKPEPENSAFGVSWGVGFRHFADRRGSTAGFLQTR